MQTAYLRELDTREVEELSGGNSLAIGTIGGAFVGGAVYSYDVAISNASFDWSTFTGAILQGAVTGFLVGLGGLAFSVPGGTVAGVSAEGLAAVINMTDPYKSLE
jgi:hypothetical protein